MNEFIQYGKYGLVGVVTSVSGFRIFDLIPDLLIAFFIGFVGAMGGFLAKLLTNFIKKKLNLWLK